MCPGEREGLDVRKLRPQSRTPFCPAQLSSATDSGQGELLACVASAGTGRVLGR